MTNAPYRISAPRPVEGTPSIEERLGSELSVHRSLPLVRSLTLPVALALFVAILPISISWSRLAVLLGVAFAVFIFTVLAWSPLRARRNLVRLHANGVVVERRGDADRVCFDDVDELWHELDANTFAVGRMARIHALRLVDHQGGTHRVPLVLSDALRLFTRISSRCSERLLPDARRAVGRGESLSFGKVIVGPQTIQIGRWSQRWEDLRLVRFQSGRVAFFRRQTVFPSRMVSFDQVPHPAVFVAIVQERAKRVETAV